MFWWILLGVSVALLILGIIFWCVGKKNLGWYKSDYGKLATTGVWFTVVFGISVFMLGLALPIAHFYNLEAIATFEKQKEYFEQVVPTLEDGENYALTQKKIELNEWLYQAQYNKKHYSFFSLYPDSVLELEEIK